MEEQKLAAEAGLMDSRKVAEQGHKALMKEKPFAIPGFQNWLLAQAPRQVHCFFCVAVEP